MQEGARPRILFVDDEPDLLAAMARNLRSEQFEVSTASSGAQALEMLRNAGPFAVIVSDLHMPAMDGVEVLRRARRLCPDTVRVLFTGQPDLDNAIAAVNEGAIFRFMIKPCPRIRLALTLRGAADQYHLITAERVLLEQTLHGSIKALTDILGLASPMAFGRATRLRQAVGALGSTLEVSERWHIEVAAMLSQIGYVILPPATIEKVYQGEVLSEGEEKMMRRIPPVVEQILGHIPRLEPVREILHYQHKRFDGSGPPAGATAGEEIPWGARALKLALDLDILESEGTQTSLAFDTLRGRAGWYDPIIVEALAEIRQSEQRSEVRELPVSGLSPGMILAQDLRTTGGVLFVARGQEVTASLVEKLRNFRPHLLGEKSIRVIIRDLSTAGSENHDTGHLFLTALQTPLPPALVNVALRRVEAVSPW